MGLETVLLKGARVQKFLAALFYLVSAVRFKLYIMCAPAKNFGILCTLALLHPWIQTRPRQSDSSHIFGPCRPRVAVFRAGWGRNRSPPGPVCGRTEAILRVQGSVEQIFFFSANALNLEFAADCVLQRSSPLGRASRALVQRCRTAR